MFDKLIEKIDKDIIELEDKEELKRIKKLRHFYIEIHNKILKNNK